MKNKFDLGQRVYFYRHGISVSVLYEGGKFTCTSVEDLQRKLSVVSAAEVVGVSLEGDSVVYTVEIRTHCGGRQLCTDRYNIRESGLYSTPEEARRVVIAGLASHAKTLGKFLGEEIQ